MLEILFHEETRIRVPVPSLYFKAVILNKYLTSLGLSLLIFIDL